MVRRRVYHSLVELYNAKRRHLCVYDSLDLANRALANVTANGAAASPTSFSFYSNAGVVAEVTTASLANETVLSLRNNSLTSIPASLFSAMPAVKSMYGTDAVLVYTEHRLTGFRWRSDISENPLTELESSSFVGMSKLEVIEYDATLAAVVDHFPAGS